MNRKEITIDDRIKEFRMLVQKTTASLPTMKKKAKTKEQKLLYKDIVQDVKEWRMTLHTLEQYKFNADFLKKIKAMEENDARIN